MKVKKGRFEFSNVIGYKVKSNFNDLIKHIAFIKASIIANDVCATGPVIVCGELNDKSNEEKDLTLLVPINRKVELRGENNKFFYQEKFLIEECLKVRHTELEDDINATEKFLELVATKNSLKLKKPYYYVYLPVYQEYVIDIWAEVEKE